MLALSVFNVLRKDDEYDDEPNPSAANIKTSNPAKYVLSLLLIMWALSNQMIAPGVIFEVTFLIMDTRISCIWLNYIKMLFQKIPTEWGIHIVFIDDASGISYVILTTPLLDTMPTHYSELLDEETSIGSLQKGW